MYIIYMCIQWLFITVFTVYTNFRIEGMFTLYFVNSVKVLGTTNIYANKYW